MKFLIVASLTCSFITAYGQKFTAVESKVRFFSEAPLENITASNTDAASAYDSSTGEIVFSVPISSFQFRKSLMQQHFNEKFMESEKYPRAVFKGTIDAFDVNRRGEQEVRAKGTMVIHGVTRPVTATGTMEHKNGHIQLNSVLSVRPEDYKIKIPKILWRNIAEEVEVFVSFIYKPL